jgi:hypothetical protein
MEITPEIIAAIRASNNFAILHKEATIAADALRSCRSDMIDGILTKEELYTLYEANKILSTLINRTGFQDMKYFITQIEIEKNETKQ